ncbi:hypothetical protein EVAR_87421_1 [Eumeta japonica]|uniref:Uncharacterized protein n=1 Tax=Eumeta variegata TaxID=151549 RepID=A0A4C1XL89_EUMVA|nr:hypothetical protein EVAR_87421_1 [Eumeta japonica]
MLPTARDMGSTKRCLQLQISVAVKHKRFGYFSGRERGWVRWGPRAGAAHTGRQCACAQAFARSLILHVLDGGGAGGARAVLLAWQRVQLSATARGAD